MTSDQFSKISPKSNPIKSDLSDEQMVINLLPVEILSKTIKMFLSINYRHSDKDMIIKKRLKEEGSFVLIDLGFYLSLLSLLI